jgi:hypothetical protein
MRNRLPANVRLAIVMLAVVTTAAFRAAARRAKARGIPAAESAPATAEDSRPVGPGDQVQSVFHELHADGHHALCGVCNYA